MLSVQVIVPPAATVVFVEEVVVAFFTNCIVAGPGDRDPDGAAAWEDRAVMAKTEVAEGAAANDGTAEVVSTIAINAVKIEAILFISGFPQ
jgi:hypothetical protein